MKASSVSTLKKELSALPVGEVVDICMKLVKYRKENKELLSYLLFDANNELAYIQGIKAEIDIQFNEINLRNLYFAKKSVRKILKLTNKYIKYSSNKQTEVELLIHFCRNLKHSGIPFRSSNSLSTLYARQMQKIRLLIKTMHEDLQHDYDDELAGLD